MIKKMLTVLMGCAMLAGATGCGIKRDLYLPDNPPPKKGNFPNKPLPAPPDANDLKPITPDDF